MLVEYEYQKMESQAKRLNPGGNVKGYPKPFESGGFAI
jgi:hypothetical protein